MAQVKLDHTALGEILKSTNVELELLKHAEQAKAAAEAAGVTVERGTNRPMPYQVRSDPARDRARVFVIASHPAGLAAEAKHGTLRRALDSAR